MTNELPGGWDSLEREARPPNELKGRVIRTLRAGGRLRPTRPRWVAPVGAAAALAIFAVGALVGHGMRQPPGDDPRPKYLLLLYERPDTPEPETVSRVQEYGEWARQLSGQGRLTMGEELAPSSQVITAGVAGPAQPGPEAGSQVLVGFFIIRATDSDDALAIARTNPHLRYGGSIVIRPIQPT